MGSGKRLEHAKKKYLRENCSAKITDRFKKEILFFCEDMDQMRKLEKVLVNEEYVARQDTYNLGLGGQGGYLCECSAETRKKLSESSKGKRRTDEMKKKYSLSKIGKKRGPMSAEQKLKISKANKGDTRRNTKENVLCRKTKTQSF